jgi:hypothetical protein
MAQKDKTSMWIESAPGLPQPKGEPPKREEKRKMPPVQDVTRQFRGRLTRTAGRARVRRSSRQRA